MGVDHAPHPLHFAGEVAVIDARLDDGLDELRPVQRVRTHRGHHHAGRRGQRIEGVAVGGIGHEARDVGAGGSTDFVQLVGITAGDRPPQLADGAVPTNQVPAQDLADEARRSVDDHIEVALLGHRY